MSKRLFPMLFASMSMMPATLALAQAYQSNIEEEVVVIGIRDAQ